MVTRVKGIIKFLPPLSHTHNPDTIKTKTARAAPQPELQGFSGQLGLQLRLGLHRRARSPIGRRRDVGYVHGPADRDQRAGEGPVVVV